MLTDVGGFLERKQAEGIDVAVLCNAMLNLPGASVDNLSLDQVKAWNEFARGLVASADGRVQAFVGINPFGGAEMLEEMRTAVTSGDFRGVTINATVKGRHLGEPELEDFWSLAEELMVPVLIHPSSSPPGSDVFSELSLLEYAVRPTEVALSLAAVVLSGVLDRHPRLRLIAGAGGVALPMLLLRLDVPHRYGAVGPPGAKRASSNEAPSSYLPRLYADTCSFDKGTVEFNLRTLGADHVLFGTDSPPLNVPTSAIIDMIAALPVTDREREQILGGSAARLLGLAEM